MGSTHDSSIGYLVYNAQRSIAKSLEAILKPYNITPGQWNLINRLNTEGPLSQKDLAQATRKEQATITRYLDTLERKELVVRSQHKTDRRSHMVSLTDKARDLIQEATPITVEATEHLVTNVDPRELHTFLKVLNAIQINAESLVDEK